MAPPYSSDEMQILAIGLSAGLPMSYIVVLLVSHTNDVTGPLVAWLTVHSGGTQL